MECVCVCVCLGCVILEFCNGVWVCWWNGGMLVMYVCVLIMLRVNICISGICRFVFMW